MVWADLATAGLKDKFTLLKNEAIESEQLKSVYDLMMRVKDL